MFLIDTNVISEVRKGERSDTRVAAWYASTGDSGLFLSVLVLGEIRCGVDRARRTDARKADALEGWLRRVEKAFGPRVLAVDAAVAVEWGRMAAIRPIPVIDGLLAATAKVHDLTLVTRDDEAVAGLGARILNPFQPAGRA